MKSKVYIFGTLLEGFQWYPSINDGHFYERHYNGSDDDKVFEIFQSNTVVRYVYLRYGFVSALTNGRLNSFLGIAIEIPNNYITKPLTLFKQIDSLFNVLCKDKKLIEERLGRFYFVPQRFNHISEYLDKYSDAINSYVNHLNEKENLLEPISQERYAEDGKILGKDEITDVTPLVGLLVFLTAHLEELKKLTIEKN